MNKIWLHIANLLVLIMLLFFNLTIFWSTAGLSEGGMVPRLDLYNVSIYDLGNSIFCSINAEQ